MNLPFNFVNFIRDNLLMMLAWFLLATSFFSWGALLSKILSINIDDKKGIIAKICIFFFSIYHFFLPIDAYASSLFYFLGILFFFIKYIKKLHNFAKSLGYCKIVVIILILFSISSVAIQIPTNLDTGFYHLNSIRWANEYHIIKGLGNLHAKLGFNQLFFIYAASLNFHPYLNDYAFHTSNGFLCALFFVGMILNGTFIDLLLICLFFFIPMPFTWISSPTPDIASTFIQIVAFRYYVEVIFFNPNNTKRIQYITFVAILSALLITVKLSNVVLAAGFGLVTIIFHIKHHFTFLEKRILRNSFIFILILFTIWIIRGYIQTGYPLFPSSFGKINFVWTVPEEIARIERECVYAGSRSCERTFKIDSPLLKNNAWIEYWIKKHFFNKDIYLSKNIYDNIYIIINLLLFPFTLKNWGIGSVILLLFSTIFFLLYLINIFINKNLLTKNIVLLSLFLAILSSIAFCFLTAPCPRFANGTIIILFMISLLFIKSIYPKIIVKKRIKTILLFYPLIMFIWNFHISYETNEFLINGILILEKSPMIEYVTKYGLKVYMPQNNAIDIWDSKIPATPNEFNMLSLIETDINDGFYLKEKIKINMSR